MDMVLRNNASASAEFSGRQQSKWQCCELVKVSRRCLPCPYSGRQIHVDWLSPRKLPHPWKGSRRQASVTARGRLVLSAAALSDAAAFPGASLGPSTAVSTVTVEPPPQATLGASAPTVAAGSGAPTVAAAATVVVAEGGTDGSHDTLVSVYSSFEDLGALTSTSLDYDSDGPEMCALVADPSGDVQVVCESDPTHPLSLAEAAVFNPPLSPTLLQDIEAKLEADLTTIAVTILFAVGFISLEFGVNDLIENYFGDSLFSDVVCVSVGLVVVFWVRLSKVRLMRFDRWR